MPDEPAQQTGGNEGQVAVQEPPAPAAPNRQQSKRPQPQRPPVELLPRFKVLLHNDDVNDMDYVIRSVCRITPLGVEDAIVRVLEAHLSGLSLLLVTHQELAELYQDQFTSASLTVTIEPE